ncbi:MAG: hypothetical protein MUC56_13355 [Thermoanaerobaculales bacterium]|nr:hypothetical protein [Thermoanaerobaculales bacterium]
MASASEALVPVHPRADTEPARIRYNPIRQTDSRPDPALVGRGLSGIVELADLMTTRKASPPIEDRDPPTVSHTAAGDLSPIQLTALTAFAIFVGEALIMIVLPVFGELPMAVEAILDAVLITIITAPVLSFLLFRPMVEHIAERKTAERSLRELNEDLERRVDERTNELVRANRALQKEIQDHEATEDRLRRTNDFVKRLVESAPCIMATIDVNTLRSNYVNSRLEDFLDRSPEAIAAASGKLLESIMDAPSLRRCRDMIDSLIAAPEGGIVGGQLPLNGADGTPSLFRVGVTVSSRSPIGDVTEVLFVATLVDGCD